MSETPTTDERLKTYLNGNILGRERLCSAILASDRRFASIKPRHPAGGPDGGVDLEANFRGDQYANVAVGFLNNAHDGTSQLTAIKKKFRGDLDKCAAREHKPDVFVFFTNVNLTLKAKADLEQYCQQASIPTCEIYDRERCRLSLDSPDGLAARFTFLNIPLSAAEQATFFSRWGDDIQSVITNGFSGVEASLRRIQFLYEATEVLAHCNFQIELDRTYTAVEVDHFRCFCHIWLKEPRHGLWELITATTDNGSRLNAKTVAELDGREGGVARSICGMTWGAGDPKAWNRALPDAGERPMIAIEDEDRSTWQLTSFNSIGVQEVTFLTCGFGFDGGLFRHPPYLTLKDLDDCMFTFFTDKKLASRIKTIHVTANEYKLAEFTRRQLRIGPPNSQPSYEMVFSPTELENEWVRIMHGLSSFKICFSSTTPTRLFEPEPVVDSLSERRKQRLNARRKMRE